MIKKTEVKELANIENDFCVSVYIPTHRSGQETLKGNDLINLKTQLKDIKTKLEDRGMRSDNIDDFVKPIQDLIDDTGFWRHQSDGLAILLTEDIFKKYTVPLHFDAFNYVSDGFYLTPLLPLFEDNHSFYILTLTEDDTALYEATKYNIGESELPDSIPKQLEDRVGYDHEQKSLQFRSGQQGNKGEAAYHGHGEGSAEDKNELKRYFRAIDKGLMEILHDNQKPPMILCCQDYQYPIYKEINSYQNLYDNHISGNPADMNEEQLHKEAWKIVGPHFEKEREQKKKDFAELHGTGKATSDLNDIMKSTLQGKIDSLFIEKGEDVYGHYDASKMKIKVEDESTPSNVSLMNMIAIKVIEMGGHVYLTEKENMPDDSAKMNAVLRF